MKTGKSIVLLFLIIISYSIFSVVNAQQKQTRPSDSSVETEKINENDVIARLADQRISFNKNPSKNNLPKAEYIINRSNFTIINFNGLDYYVKNNRLIGIKGLNLSDSVLNQITAKLVLLDSIQFNQTERLNNEYLNPSTDLQKAWYIDRQFMLTLKMLTSTVRDIAAFTKSENPALAIEANVAKMRLPNINKAVKKSDMQSLVSLSK
ncbi:hypothetical protein [Pedobacter sp. KLB.chiD]|uniref:hypothetical protein n=1 Tax=Pedobacter sp. KLB.chiD TaxID=3387402 RepID=UPI0039997CA5